MRVDVIEHGSGNRTVILNRNRELHALSEHDLRDIEFVLAQRRAMSRRCTSVSGEHTCGLDPGHTVPVAHLCRACTRTWADAPA